jgi:anti-sigma-K factor RskA
MSHVSHEAFDTLVAVYAVGALDGDDLRAFEAHLAAGCDRCHAALRESDETLARVALAGPREIPPADVKATLLRRIGDGPARRVSERQRWLPWVAATAAAVVIGAMLTGGFVASRYEAKLGHMARELAREREEMVRKEATLRAELATYRSPVELLRDPATRVVELHGAGPSTGATGRVVWHQRAGGHLVVANLPPTPAGQAYEVWMLGGAAPRPAGVFTVDAAGQASHRLEAAAGEPIKAFAVTVEPQGGVPAPTGPVVLASR